MLAFASHLAGQTFGEAFGTNSRSMDPVDAQNKYPLIRAYELWADHQGYDSDDVPNWPLDNFNFENDDRYYDELESDVVPVPYGLPGEMRGISSFDGLKWIIQKPLLPVSGPGDDAPFSLGNTEITSTMQYFGDWLAANVNQESPHAWLLKAHWMTLLADRYGASDLTPFTRAVLHQPSLGAGSYVTPPGAGGGRTLWFEAENEPDRTWLDAPARLDSSKAMWQHTPAILAAQTSMLYDGHGRSDAAQWPLDDDSCPNPGGECPQTRLGVKRVSSDNKVAVAGLAGLRGNYVKEMVDWFAVNRQPGVFGYVNGDNDEDGTQEVLAFDALSFHHYPSSSSITAAEEYDENSRLQWDVGDCDAVAQSPETHGLRQRVEYLIGRLYAEINQAHPNLYSEMAGKEIWLSEFGYDSDNLAPCTPIGGGLEARGGIQIPDLADVNSPGDFLDKEVVQAQWLARSYLELMAARADIPALAGSSYKRLDRFMQYELADLRSKPTGGPGTEQFQSTGLYTKSYEPKASHFYTRALLYHLGEYAHQFTGPPDMNDASNRDQFPSTLGQFVEVVPSQSAPVPTADEDHPVMYQFTRAFGDGAQDIWALWSPTEAGYEFGVEVDIRALLGGPDPPNISSITVIRLQDLADRGVVEQVDLAGGVATLTVTEEPLLFRLGGVDDRVTSVAPPRGIGIEDLCCGDLEVRFSRNRRVLSSTFTIGYAPASAAVSGVVDLSDITIVAQGVPGGSTVIPGLDPGTGYYIFVLPTNSSGYGYDYSAGVPIGFGFDPLYPGLAVAQYFVPSTCSDGGNGCNYVITADQISYASPDPINTSAQDLANVLSGGLGSSAGFCSDDGDPRSTTQWASNAAGSPSTAIVTFDPPVNISQAVLWDGGAVGNTPGVRIEYATCECPDDYRSLADHNWEGYGARSAYVSHARRVTSLRITKSGMNLAGLSLCAEETTCKVRFFQEAPMAEVDVVGDDFARVSWVSAYDTVSHTEPESYVLRLASSLAADGSLNNPVQFKASSGTGSDLAYKFENLDPGTTYYGRVVPTDDCFETAPYPLERERPAYSPTDTSFFTFTTPSTEAGGEHGSDGNHGRLAPQAAATPASAVFPNPAHAYATVTAELPIERIDVYDGTGRALTSIPGQATRQLRVDLVGYAPGVIHLAVVTERGVDTHLVRVE